MMRKISKNGRDVEVTEPTFPVVSVPRRRENPRPKIDTPIIDAIAMALVDLSVVPGPTSYYPLFLSS